jgi:hypothetical protein
MCSFSFSILLVHNFCDLIGRWEALINKFEIIVEELVMIFKVIFFSSEEFINLGQPA